jgi:hypothetical protein
MSTSTALVSKLELDKLGRLTLLSVPGHQDDHLPSGGTRDAVSKTMVESLSHVL